MDLIACHDFCNNQMVMVFNFPVVTGRECFELRANSDPCNYKVTLDQKLLSEFIEFLQRGLVASQVKEPDYEQQRGISVPVDTNPSRE